MTDPTPLSQEELDNLGLDYRGRNLDGDPMVLVPEPHLRRLLNEHATLTERLARAERVVKAARKWSAADHSPNHAGFFRACSRLHDALAALDSGPTGEGER